jgi:hypothetical protein
MDQKINRRGAVKMIATVGGLMLINSTGFAGIQRKVGLASGWLYNGQACSLQRAGATLLLINENGAVGSAIFTGENTLLVLGGSGWDAGLTAQITNRGRIINWSNNTVWIKGPNPPSPPEIANSWLYQAQACAIYQQANQLLLINEVGAIGTALWSGSDRFTVLGGAGWDLGLIGQLVNGGDRILWTNNTIWTKN